MIHKRLYFYDVEVLPNYFSIAIVKANDFNKAVLKSLGNNINISNIKRFKYHYIDILNKKKSLDSDVKVLKAFFSFLLNNNAILVGFNNLQYDQCILAFLFDKIVNNTFTSKTLSELKVYSNNLINSDNYSLKYKYINKNDFIQLFPQIDVFKMNHFDRFGVGLKKVQSIMEMTNIAESPISFDKIVTDSDIPSLKFYNLYDTVTTYKFFIEHCKDLWEVRYDKYLNDPNKSLKVFSYSNTSLGTQTLLNEYSKKTKIPIQELKVLKTERKFFTLADVISPSITFKTKELQNFLSYLKNKKINLAFKDIKESITFKNVVYDLGKGGLHGIIKKNLSFKSSDKEDIIDFDFGSYYPFLMMELNISPSHLDKTIFLNILKTMTYERLKFKSQSKDRSLSINAKKSAKTKAADLKIVINSIYGLLGSEYSFLYDKKALAKVTINGQLFLLMLSERLSLNPDIQCFYANTDGLTFLVNKDKSVQKYFYDTCEQFNKIIKIPQEFINYTNCFIKDVNNYIIKDINDNYKLKGIYVNDLLKQAYLPFTKNLSKIIVSKVSFDYLINNQDIYTNLAKRLTKDDLLKFSINIKATKAEKKGKSKFVLHQLDNNNNYTIKKELNKQLRYVIVKKGTIGSGILIKKYQNGDSAYVDAPVKNYKFYSLPINDLKDEQQISYILKQIDLNYYHYNSKKLINFTTYISSITTNQLKLF